MGLLTYDEHGSPAYSCPDDTNALTVIEDGPVLQCPTCGHRTDEPGEGVLGDGFDIIHRQWGLRGDPHAWRALRELVAATPTPASAEGVRQAFVDGLRQVAGVDIDATGEQQVYREHLDHGGMSGGNLDVGWWRSKGIPLLVDRAIARRPPSPAAAGRRSIRGVLASIAIWAIVLTIAVAPITIGGWNLYQRYVGTHVQATVLECDTSGNYRRYGPTIRTECVARWTIDGRTVIGNFQGGNGKSDAGKTVDATVRGDTAYSRSLVLPLVLIGLGLPFLLFPVLAVRRRLRGSKAQRAGTSDPPPAASA